MKDRAIDIRISTTIIVSVRPMSNATGPILNGGMRRRNILIGGSVIV